MWLLSEDELVLFNTETGFYFAIIYVEKWKIRFYYPLENEKDYFDYMSYDNVDKTMEALAKLGHMLNQKN